MSVRDVIFTGVLVFSIALAFFVINFAMNTMVDSIVVIDAINESSGAVNSFQGIKTMVSRLDYVVFGLYIGLVFGMIITGWFIGGNPIFMFIYFIVVVIGVVVSVVLANTWETITQNAVFGITINAFPLSNNLLLHLPLYTTIIGFVGIVVMFAKPYLRGTK